MIDLPYTDTECQKNQQVSTFNVDSQSLNAIMNKGVYLSEVDLSFGDSSGGLCSGEASSGPDRGMEFKDA